MPSKYDNAVIPVEQSVAREIPSEQELATQHNQNPQMFMQEENSLVVSLTLVNM